MWNIPDAEYIVPSKEAVYFIWLPEDNEIYYSSNLNNFGSPMMYNGSIENWARGQGNCPMIPIDPHLALSLNWVTVDEMVRNMSYVTDTMKAALKLIKDVKD